MSRRFYEGWGGTFSGIRFRVVRGAKGPNDLRMDWTVNGTTWTAIEMEVGFVLAAFFYENEEVLYPQPQFKGGKKYLDDCKWAALHGWEKAAAGLRAEKDMKRAKERDIEPPSLFGDEGEAA